MSAGCGGAGRPGSESCVRGRLPWGAAACAGVFRPPRRAGSAAPCRGSTTWRLLWLVRWPSLRSFGLCEAAGAAEGRLPSGDTGGGVWRRRRTLFSTFMARAASVRSGGWMGYLGQGAWCAAPPSLDEDGALPRATVAAAAACCLAASVVCGACPLPHAACEAVYAHSKRAIGGVYMLHCATTERCRRVVVAVALSYSGASQLYDRPSRSDGASHSLRALHVCIHRTRCVRGPCRRPAAPCGTVPCLVQTFHYI